MGMLNIHAISYHNIWPFAGKKLSVFFRGGKYLIKAPIGSGKSFLFFDGPMYGLYKHAERKMLNIHHKTGYIKIIFSIHDQRYLITRSLSQGKSKESCTSQQYIIHDSNTIESYLHSDTIIQHDVDIEELLRQQSVAMEEISYKNETDLQQTLTTLLPPREVFSSTMFLLQESQNIFELTPGDRIDILKNIFDLMSIDSAKDSIADKRREVQLQKKILGDTQHQDSKLRVLVGQIITRYHALAARTERVSISSYRSAIQEREMIVDKVTLQAFSIPDPIHRLLQTLNELFKTHQQQQLQYQQHIDHIQSSIHKHSQKITQLQEEITQQQRQYKTIEQEIAQANLADPQALKQQISDIQQQQETQQASIDIAAYRSIAAKLSITPPAEDNTLAFAYQIIQASIQQGKLLTQEKENYSNQITTLQARHDEYQKQLTELDPASGTTSHQELQQAIQREQQLVQKEIDASDQAYKLLTAQEHDIQQRIQSIQDRMTALSTDNPDIAACVSEIKQAITLHDQDALDRITTIVTKYLGDKQLAALSQELHTVQEQLTHLDYANKHNAHTIHIQTLQEKIRLLTTDPWSVLVDFFVQLDSKRTQIQLQIQSLDYTSNYQTLQTHLSAVQEQIHDIKQFLQDNDYKQIESAYQVYQQQEQQKQQLYKQLDSIDSLIKEQEHKQQQLQTLQTQIQQRQQDIQSLEQDIVQDKKQLEDFVAQNTHIPTDTLQDREQQVKTIERSLHTIQELVQDHTSNQQKLTSLIQDEKILNNLHHIVSKELLLLVLGESLDVLTDIINVYLAQIFSLQLHLEIQKTSSDKVELAAYCEDEHGKREVKSLSGWQKTILKLVWMLAIASYLRSPMLFLDETINNIDTDTVSKVADMLSDFVKKNDIKLYTITHSEQIQNMNIWDGIVEVAKI